MVDYFHGTIEKIETKTAKNGSGYSILTVSGEKFADWNSLSRNYHENEEVEISYTQKGKYRNIETLNLSLDKKVFAPNDRHDTDSKRIDFAQIMKENIDEAIEVTKDKTQTTMLGDKIQRFTSEDITKIALSLFIAKTRDKK